MTNENKETQPERQCGVGCMYSGKTRLENWDFGKMAGAMFLVVVVPLGLALHANSENVAVLKAQLGHVVTVLAEVKAGGRLPEIGYTADRAGYAQQFGKRHGGWHAKKCPLVDHQVEQVRRVGQGFRPGMVNRDSRAVEPAAGQGAARSRHYFHPFIEHLDFQL